MSKKKRHTTQKKGTNELSSELVVIGRIHERRRVADYYSFAARKSDRLDKDQRSNILQTMHKVCMISVKKTMID
jgi:uncharacterized tellurite resistance protein B-like protein